MKAPQLLRGAHDRAAVFVRHGIYVRVAKDVTTAGHDPESRLRRHQAMTLRDWTRLHGMYSPRIERHFRMGLPGPALLDVAEVDAFVRGLNELIA